MVLEPLLNAVCRCSGPKCFCFQRTCCKNWHIIQFKKKREREKLLVCSTASFQSNASQTYMKVKGRKDKRGVLLTPSPEDLLALCSVEYRRDSKG